MEAQDKPCPSISSRLLILLIRLIPVLGLAMAGSALGFQLMELIDGPGNAHMLIIFLALFLAMNLLIQEPGWNLVLLLGFSITSGLVMNWTGVVPGRWGTWILFLGLITAALSRVLKQRDAHQINLINRIPTAGLYLTGWLVIIIWNLSGWILKIWIIWGLILFTMITADLLKSGLTLRKKESPVPLGIEIWVVLLNLFWLSSLLKFG